MTILVKTKKEEEGALEGTCTKAVLSGSKSPPKEGDCALVH
jgi:hypothetical protein